MNSGIDPVRTSFDEVDASPKGLFNSDMKLRDTENNHCVDSSLFRPSFIIVRTSSHVVLI